MLKAARRFDEEDLLLARWRLTRIVVRGELRLCDKVLATDRVASILWDPKSGRAFDLEGRPIAALF